MIKALLKAKFRDAQKPVSARRPWHAPTKYSRIFLTVLGFLLMPVITFAEIFTHRQFGLSLFYFLSIFMVTRGAGVSWGMAASLAGTGIWFWTDLQFEVFSANVWILASKAVIRFCFFASVVGILRSLEKEKKFARRDFLTGISNRQAFFELAGVELNRAKRYARPLSFAYLDCDYFKQINDSYGHHAGNKLLKNLAETLQNNIRNTDIAVRLGGDEFGLLMPEADFEAARLAVARIQKILHAAIARNGWPTTVSIGVMTYLDVPPSVDTMIQLADDLMYGAKKAGKNTIHHEIFKQTAAGAAK